MAKSGFKVVIIESEQGWGQRVDEILYFMSVEKADAFVRGYNLANTERIVPYWYMYAEEAVFVRDIPDNAVFEDELDG